MANTNRSINLLPGKDGGFVTQFLNWALTIGRLLIILVETLALGTFLYRFNLDMKIIDLHDQIKQQSFIVGSFERQEEEFRNLQTRLAMAKTYGENNPTTTMFQDIVAMGRGKVTFRNLLVTLDTARIEAEGPSANALSTFTDTLRNHPSVQEVSVDRVENKASTATVVLRMTVKFKTNPNLISANANVTPTVSNPEAIPNNL